MSAEQKLREAHDLTDVIEAQFDRSVTAAAAFAVMEAAVGRLLEPIPEMVLTRAEDAAYKNCRWPDDDADLDVYREVIVAWLIGGDE